MFTFSCRNMIEITIYSNFHNVLLIFLFNFHWLPWSRTLWKNCLAFHDFPLMFCGGTLTNAPSVVGSSYLGGCYVQASTGQLDTQIQNWLLTATTSFFFKFKVMDSFYWSCRQLL